MRIVVALFIVVVAASPARASGLTDGDAMLANLSGVLKGLEPTYMDPKIRDGFERVKEAVTQRLDSRDLARALDRTTHQITLQNLETGERTPATQHDGKAIAKILRKLAHAEQLMRDDAATLMGDAKTAGRQMPLQKALFESPNAHVAANSWLSWEGGKGVKLRSVEYRNNNETNLNIWVSTKTGNERLILQDPAFRDTVEVPLRQPKAKHRAVRPAPIKGNTK